MSWPGETCGQHGPDVQRVYRTDGIGPKIKECWSRYFDAIPHGAAGVDSLGDLIMSDKSITKAEENVYNPMMSKWYGSSLQLVPTCLRASSEPYRLTIATHRYKLVMAAADGLGEDADAVAQTIHDALTDPFLQPNYTVGYDALLGQMARDLTPESIWELGMAKTFG